MSDFYLKQIRLERKDYELLLCLEEYFQRPHQYTFHPNGDIKAFVYSKFDAGYFLEVVLDKRGGIVQIDPENKVPKEEVKAIRHYIKEALLDDTGSKVGQTVCFLKGTVEQVFTCQYFQILPVPPQAPKPTMGIMQYPFLFQFIYPTSSNMAVDRIRKQEIEQRYLNLLSLFLHPTIEQSPQTYHPGWTFDRESPLSEERFLGYVYDFHSFSPSIDAFSDTSGYQTNTPIPASEYYTGIQVYFPNVIIVGDTELKLPDNIVASFEKVDGLSAKDRENFLRACHWLRLAQIQRPISPSSSLISLVSAVECLIEKNLCSDCNQEIIAASGRCKTCGEPIYRITAAFKQFVEQWVPEAAQYTNALGLLYNTRSSIVHGSGILLNDSHPWIYFMAHKQASDENGIYELAYRLTKRVLFNWLYGVKYPNHYT